MHITVSLITFIELLSIRFIANITLINLQYWSVSASLSATICFWREMGEREERKRQRGSPLFFFSCLYLFAPSSRSEGLEQAITSRFKTKPELDPGGRIELN